MSNSTIYIDKFAITNLPPGNLQPEFIFELPELKYPEKLNCTTKLLDEQIDLGHGDNIAVIGEHYQWSYADLNAIANRIANVLVDDMGLQTGNRVLLRAPNNPMLVACWLAVLKAGGIVVATMPLMRSRDLKPVVDKAQVTMALCDSRLSDQLNKLTAERSSLETVMLFDSISDDAQLNKLMAEKSSSFETTDTASDDVALIAFTSGTTGLPKGCMHFHRDVISMAICFSQNILKPTEKDIFIGTPPIAFTFGLGALVVFPLYAGAATVMVENTTPNHLARAMDKFKATISFTSPTGYRSLMSLTQKSDLESLRISVSAGEPLSAVTSNEWFKLTGIRLIDGIGSTEMMHIFVSTSEQECRVGSTGRPIPGYQACVLDKDHQPAAVGEEGFLAVKGPTGCRYLSDERQKEYVINGWNITGDIYSIDLDGYFWFKGRSDDIIISAGYNISGVEVENALLGHQSVAECAVVGVPDSERGNLVKAYIVLNKPYTPGEELVAELKDFVKSEIAPYKYPRAIEFIDDLPRTLTGKIQRYKLSGR